MLFGVFVTPAPQKPHKKGIYLINIMEKPVVPKQGLFRHLVGQYLPNPSFADRDGKSCKLQQLCRAASRPILGKKRQAKLQNKEE